MTARSELAAGATGHGGEPVPAERRGWPWQGIALALLAANGAYLAAGGAAGDTGAWFLSNLLLHVAGGLALLPPSIAWWLRYRRRQPAWRRTRLDGGACLLLGAAAAGILLVLLGNRRPLRPLFWAHVALAVAGLAVLVAASAGSPRRLPRRGALAALLLPLLALALIRLLAAGGAGGATREFQATAPRTLAGEAMGGAAGPFYPSALSTRSGGLLPAREVAESGGCGRSGCHPAILAEWSASAHRYSGLDNPWYRRSYEEMRRTAGATAARWCGGCHTPALLASGLLDRPPAEIAETPAARAGVSCGACHAVARVKSTRGQADLELDRPLLHRLEVSPRPGARALHDLLVRIDPGPHRRIYSRFLAAGSAAELCSACHKAHMEGPLNGYRFQMVMDDYDPWQATSASGEGVTQSIYFPPPAGCVDCHMPGTAGAGTRRGGGEPDADGGAHPRSHSFAAANTALPALHHDTAQLGKVTAFLQASRIGLDLFAMSQGTAVYAPLDRLPAALRRGETTRLDIVVRNRGVGHFFPGGKYVGQDCWLEVLARDDRGRTIFWSGRTQPGGAVDPGAHFFGSLWVDLRGRPTRGYEVWHNHSEVYTQRLEPNAAALARFLVKVPADAGDRLTLIARLRYRKFRPDFTLWAFAGLPGGAPEVPIVTLAEKTLTLPVTGAGAPLPTMTRPVRVAADWERWNDYAYALANQGDFAAARPALATALALRPRDAEVWTTLANVDWAALDLPAARRDLDRAFALDAGLPRARVVQGMMELRAASYAESLVDLRAAAARFPRDADLLREIGHALLRSGDYRGAVAAFDESLAIDSENPAAHFMLVQAYRHLGDWRRAAEHLALFKRFHGQPSPAGDAYTERDPDAARERLPLHEHLSLPLADEALGGH